MSIATYEKLKREIKNELFYELGDLILKEAKDPEGEYKPDFVKKILKFSQKKQKTHQYNPNL